MTRIQVDNPTVLNSYRSAELTAEACQLSTVNSTSYLSTINCQLLTPAYQLSTVNCQLLTPTVRLSSRPKPVNYQLPTPN